MDACASDPTAATLLFAVFTHISYSKRERDRERERESERDSREESRRAGAENEKLSENEGDGIRAKVEQIFARLRRVREEEEDKKRVRGKTRRYL